MKGLTILDVRGVLAACGHSLTDKKQCMGPTQAYYWCAMNKLSASEVVQVAPPPVPHFAMPVKTPAIFMFHRQADETLEGGGGAAAFITVRGTRLGLTRDLLVDISASLGHTILRKTANVIVKKVRHNGGSGRGAGGAGQTMAAVKRSMESLLAQDLAQVKAYNLRFHHGFYLQALRCLGPLLIALCESGILNVPTATDEPHVFTAGRATNQSPMPLIQLYGHSMGGACVSFLFGWLRRLTRGVNVRCVSMACPMICDLVSQRLWFLPHGTDDPARFRHYYTEGDPIVFVIPGAAGFTHHASGTNSTYFAPMVGLGPRTSFSQRLTDRLLAHVSFQPALFRSALGAAPPGKVKSSLGDVVLANTDIAEILRARGVFTKAVRATPLRSHHTMISNQQYATLMVLSQSIHSKMGNLE